ncbi:claspin isoform X1 [Bombus huntii]|uniref:claspin isoform X1 n=1 Tax=Bombus huntii TaxID=85661 RepID=UPI0021AAB1C1|nr:claspin isoform X1 [Bombus huntii]
MSENKDLDNNNECHVQLEFRESEITEQSEQYTEEQKNKCLEIKNCSDIEKENIFNETLREENQERAHKNDKHENETNYSESNVDNSDFILNKFVKEKDCESEQKNDESKSQVNNNSDINTDMLNRSIKDKDKTPDQKDDKLKNNNIHSRLFSIIDSDSEEENIFTSKSKKKNVIDDEDEISNSKHDNMSTKNLNKSSTMKLIDSDSDDTSNTIHVIDTEKTASNGVKVVNNMKSRLQDLVDLESDKEREESDEEREESDEPSSPVRQSKTTEKHKKKDPKLKPRKVSLRASKEEAMKQIQSETQRLVRETEISLPYHNPKQRTIQEFLERRKVISSFPVPTVASKLKEFSGIVSEILKEKEKEAEIFYKSSDSEEESTENNKENTDKGHINIQCTEDVKKDNVSRKLFDDDLSTTKNNEEDNEEEDNRNTMEVENETLAEAEDIECNKIIASNETENNATNSVQTIETHCKSSIEDKTEAKISETVANEKIDGLLQKDISQNEHKGKSICIDNDEHSLEILNDNAKIAKDPFGITTNESDEYDEYDFPPLNLDDLDDLDSPNRIKHLQDIRSLKPKLRGIPGQIIDLADDITSAKKGIHGLINRFVKKHSKSDRPVKNISKITTTQIKETPNGGLSIIKETLPYRLPYIENKDPKLEKPGAKLIRLKEELKRRMAIKRNEEWKQREQEMKEQEIEWNESINEEDTFNEPYSPNIEPHISEEDDVEEDDVYTKIEKKKKKKSAFVEDEAEVSGDEINDSDEIEDEDEDEDEHEVQESSEEDEKSERLDSENENENSTCDSNDVPAKCKTFKRIVKPVEDDSKSSVIENDKNSKEQPTSFSQIKLDDMFGKSIKENELSNNESIPVSQVHVGSDPKYQINQTPQSKSNSFDFISPITQLTALNVHLEEDKELTTEEKLLFIDPTLTEVIQTPESPQIKRGVSQKKLFAVQDDVLDEELMEISSGKFPEDKIQLNFAKEPNVSESQLLELCSGTFSSQSNNDKESIDITHRILQNTQAPNEKDSSTTETEEKNSQHLRKETASWNKLRILSSDEDDSVEEEMKMRLKKVRKLNVSDDEDENSSAISSNNEEEEEEDDDEDEKFVDYDSEENEVIVPKKEIRQYATKFLEEEAELSESDCDVSADEDEQDLDKLELEDGDNEEIDETQVKNQLGKLHMKQMLDEDKKEVRMLQEMLFEDGDLFSESTRERKFRWRNIGKQDDNNDVQLLEGKDGWVDVSDDEDQEKWRKMRFEREAFLAANAKNIDTEIENELNSSQIFKFGLKILKKRRINELEKENTLVEALDSKTEPKVSHTVAEMLNTSRLNGTSRTIYNVMQKRSFLARGEEALTRLATLAKRNKGPLSSIKAKNFVFTNIDSINDNASNK